ncbi:hypothetical protein Tco_0598398 [Tanacetum coccineum]
MAVAAQNINNTTIRSILLAEKLTCSNFTKWYRNPRIVLRHEKKIKFMEQPIGLASDPETSDPNTIDKYYELVNLEQEVACLMLSIKAFHTCKQEEGQPVSSYLLKLKIYLDMLERLGYAMPNELGVSLILNSLNKQYDQFVQNYNMHNIGKTLAELHAMLKLHEKGIPKKAKTPAVLAIREGNIQKDKKKKPQGAKGKAKGKNKLAYAPKTKIPPPPKRDNPTKDSIYHNCKEVGYGTHICITSQGLGEIRKLKRRDLSMYMGNGMRAIFEAIRKESQQLYPNLLGYALKTAARILNLVLTKKVDRTPYKIWHEKAPKLSYLRVWGILNLTEMLEAMIRNASHGRDDQVVLVDLPMAKLEDELMQKSAKQSTNAMSSIEAEYIAASKPLMEAVWMRKFINGLGGVMPSNKRPMKMLCDNEPALAFASYPKISLHS